MCDGLEQGAQLSGPLGFWGSPCPSQDKILMSGVSARVEVMVTVLFQALTLQEEGPGETRQP